MRPAKLYLQETLDSMVNETFDRCMKSALRFPDQKRKLNLLANKVALFQKNVLTELHNSKDSDHFKEKQYFKELHFKIEKKKFEIEKELEIILPKLFE